MLFVIPMIIYGQETRSETVQISGTVTDSANWPIKGAYIYVDSAITTVRTDKKGDYSIRKAMGFKNISVFVSKVGMMTKSFTGDPEINFVIPHNLPKLTKKDLVAMGYKTDSQTAERYWEYSTIYDLIRAEFSGVTVSGSQIKVRGSAVLNGGSATPLFLVDGNYVESIAFVNPIEIKSIELLKGEEAAIYGSRGGHGVIIITLIK